MTRVVASLAAGQAAAGIGAPEAVALPGIAAGQIQPGPVTPDATTALRQLLRIEAEIRACGSVDELATLLVNEMRKLVGARQVFFAFVGASGPRLEKATGTGTIDRHAPAVRWLERELQALRPHSTWDQGGALNLRTGAQAVEDDGRTYPFAHAFWLPLRHGKASVDKGLLVLGDQPLPDEAKTLGERIAGVAAHAAITLAAKAPRASRGRLWRAIAGLSLAATVVALVWPVPMTALAPLEVVAENPVIVAAPIDGVIEELPIAPNMPVKAGDIVVRYQDTVPRNQLQLAERDVAVADAKVRQLQQTIFSDDRAKRDIAQARAELALKIAERDYARDTFEKTLIRAPRDGVAVYGDRKDWIGRPVSTGQRVLEIADPARIELRAFLPVAEIIELKPGARVRAFLDGNPLKPVEAKVTSFSHQARIIEGRGLVYRVQAKFERDARDIRLGVHGTAQLFSDTAPLGYYLFRRPLTWLRQKIGL
ncbi:MAG: efflux RND transporter periplasmic adaptor subunit [Beijerinckiaceae bacterium]